jgi:tRNA (guanine37-N1)-methyltransferase
VVRLLPGAVNDPESVAQESFATGLLDWPHYTRPELLAEGSVPAVLTSGDHDKIARWRRGQALLITQRVRPALIEQLRRAGELSPQDEDWLAGRLKG